MGQRDLELEDAEGATPLTIQDQQGLIPYVTNQRDLNEFERVNIKLGLLWARKSRFLKGNLLSVSGILRLHQELLGQVWEWAGKQRTTEASIGVDPNRILADLANLCSDTTYWLDHQTFPVEEIAVRFHHRLVQIHPFPNGNGRTARIAADLLLQFNGGSPLPWGRSELRENEEVRSQYLEALRLADQGKIEPLLAFCTE